MNRDQGSQAELLVAEHMKQQGFALLAHSYRTKTGEIDLIMQKNELVILIEVKQRTQVWFDHTELITLTKQKRIASAAYVFINSLKSKNHSFRFDVALVEGSLEKNNITYIENAFNPGRDI